MRKQKAKQVMRWLASANLLRTRYRVRRGLARSRKTEHRLRQRARIVLLAAAGMATRALGRKVGCTTGTASKWRVRYAERRLAGLDETGNRGNRPKYTTEATRRILRVLDLRPPEGYGRWSGPLIAKALGDVDVQHVWLFAGSNAGEIVVGSHAQRQASLPLRIIQPDFAVALRIVAPVLAHLHEQEQVHLHPQRLRPAPCAPASRSP